MSQIKPREVVPPQLRKEIYNKAIETILVANSLDTNLCQLLPSILWGEDEYVSKLIKREIVIHDTRKMFPELDQELKDKGVKAYFTPEQRLEFLNKNI